MSMLTNVLSDPSAPLRALVDREQAEFASYMAFNEGADSDVIASGQKVLGEAKVELESLKLHWQRITTSQTLSAYGQTQEMIVEVERANKSLAVVAKSAATRRQAADDAKQKLTAVPRPAGDPVVAELQAVEIRRRLADLPLPDRIKVFMGSMGKGKMDILMAIQNDPLAVAEVLIPADIVARVQREALERDKPAEVARFQSLEYVAEKLQVLAGSIQGLLANYGTLPSVPQPATKKMDIGLRDTQQPPPKSTTVDNPPSGNPAMQ